MQIKNTANKEEINKFNKLAEEWWDPKGNLPLYINLIPYDKNILLIKFLNILI